MPTAGPSPRRAYSSRKPSRLENPGCAPDDCGIYPGLAYNSSGTDFDPEGILLPTSDRTDGTYDGFRQTRLRSTYCPTIFQRRRWPYVASDLLTALATPFDAEAYFATCTPTPASTAPISAGTAPPQSTPTCSSGDALIADVQACDDALVAMGGRATMLQQCCRISHHRGPEWQCDYEPSECI